MKYLYSQIDRDNSNWFKNNGTINSLKSITIKEGTIRGVKNARIEFKYPITAIVGRNGAGKSTILSLVACAFHNNDKGFIPFSHISKKNNGLQHYYTYKDFFVFAKSENGIDSIVIESEYLAKDEVKKDIRKKISDGKWNRYFSRPKRKVSYLGISRVVPPSESNSHRYYRASFIQRELDDSQLKEIKDAMTYIFSIDYSELNIFSCANKNYRLASVKNSNIVYTGFNMGAGENAVCILLSEIQLAGKGALIVVDEIELGLHNEAQKKLIEVLKKWCCNHHIQLIVSTHSNKILDCIPPEGRIYIDSKTTPLTVITGISSDYAFGMLSGENSHELRIFVEDDVAKTFLETILPKNLRERIEIKSIGSSNAVLKHMASHYREGDNKYLIYLDGDKQTQHKSNIKVVYDALETRIRESKEEFDLFCNEKINYIPGCENPEKSLLKALNETKYYNDLQERFDASVDEIKCAIERGIIADVHSEFYEFAKYLAINETDALKNICQCYKKFFPEIVDEIKCVIEKSMAKNL